MNPRLRKIRDKKLDEETMRALEAAEKPSKEDIELAEALNYEKPSKEDIELAEALNYEKPAPSESNLAKITPREAEVLEAFGDGKLQKEIAADLKISVRTVRAHLESAKKKLGTKTSRGAAKAWAIIKAGPGQKV